MRKAFLLLLIMVLLYQASVFSVSIIVAAHAADISPTALNTATGGGSESGKDELSVLFINVGKADAILLRYDDKAFLIDTGDKASVPGLFGALNLFGVDRLDGVFLTHTLSDHTGGLKALALYYGVGELYSSVFSENKKNGKNVIDELAQELSLPHRKLRAGERVHISRDVFLDVLGPVVLNAQDDNDNSLVLKLSVYGRAFLFTGDMQFAGEDALLRSSADVDSDVLKVGIHGNPDATSEQFAAAVSPQAAVMSTGTREDRDSANERVLAALKGSEVFITENFTRGVLFTVRADGAVMVSDPKTPVVLANVAVTEIQRDTQTVTITNMGLDTDISKFIILSQRGNEVFLFPEGSLLGGGQSVSISSIPGADYVWPDESKVWHQEKDDSAFLYDRFGNFLSRRD